MNRRSFVVSVARLMAFLAVLPYIAGCPISQSQLGALVAEVGTALANILPYFKSVDAALASKIQAAFAALQAAVQAWKPGGAVIVIEQAVNDFVQNINLIPVLADYQPLVALIVATAEGIITLLVPTAATTTAKSAALGAPKNAKAFRAEWNGLAKANPKLAGIEIS